MLNRIIRHIRREPVPVLAVFLFAAVLSVLLCVLHQNRIREQEDYQRAYASIPVYFTVVDLDGTNLNKTIVGWAANLFYPTSKLSPSLSEFVRDLELKMQYDTTTSNGYSVEVSGVTSIRLVPEITEDYGGSVSWKEGYDERIFDSDALVCLVPESFGDMEEILLMFQYQNPDTMATEIWSCQETFTIAGYTSTRSMSRQIYMPYQALGKVLSQVYAPYDLTGISATLNDNTRLTELQEVADQWFARPNTNGGPTPWAHYGYEFYPYALDINDTLLNNLNATMERSMGINRISAVAIFCIAAGTGFLVGFLVIRSRKQDIILMRTLGCSPQNIVVELTGEQAMCVAAGVLLGGSYALWQPPGQLVLFLTLYSIGLCAAALMFLRKNLLSTMKEEE
jgi:hypothetical protein